MKDLLFYDIEVFKYDSLVVFKDINNKEVAHFWNNPYRQKVEEPSGFEGVMDLIMTHTLVGYNNYRYDDIILSCMIDPAMSQQRIIKSQNDSIIRGLGNTYRVNECIDSLDCMQQILMFPSLKQIEGNMGKSIIESSVDFNIDRFLTDAEKEETLRYCSYDVQNTIEVFKLRQKNYFETKKELIGLLPEDSQAKAKRWNTTTISANVLLGHDKTEPWKHHQVPERYWRHVNGIPDEVWTMWETACDPENALDEAKSKTIKVKSKTIKAFDCNVVMGLGGLHGAPSRPDRYDNIKLADVGSMYPSIICQMNALGDATKKYNEIRRERLSSKHTNPVKAGALKLILNSVYGNFKNKYSTLYNPLASNTVCIYGQIALFTLCAWLYEAGYKIVNINTDGVAFVDRPELNKEYDAICRKWEREFTGLLLEVDNFRKWIQKDVNNYIAIRPDGSIKVKGGEVNKYDRNNYFSNNNCRITQIAMVEHLVNGTDPIITLGQKINEPLLWQYVLKAGKTFLGVCDNQGTPMQKVNRVFAVNEGYEYTKLYKVRQDGGWVNFPDAPERMMLWNDDVNKIPDFNRKIDVSHYHGIVKAKEKGWPVNVY